MKRPRFLLRAIPKALDRNAFLVSLRAIGRSLDASLTHPRWTSYGALEIDVFAPSTQDFELLLAAVAPLSKVEFARSLDEPPRFQPKGDAIGEAVRYFNSERYWECHELLESVWRPARGDKKALVQGMILVCAALVHGQRGEREVGLGIYRRALPQIAWREKTYFGVDVPSLRRNLEDSLAEGELTVFKI